VGAFVTGNTLLFTSEIFRSDPTSLTKAKSVCRVGRVSLASRFGSVRQQALKLICIKLRR
jgi:hypothetical protein